MIQGLSWFLGLFSKIVFFMMLNERLEEVSLVLVFYFLAQLHLQVLNIAM